jgi:hypothetical protein
MKAIEFVTSMRPDGSLSLPPAVAEVLRGHDDLFRVLVLMPDEDGDAEWRRFTAEQFLAGYADSDAIYDEVQPG